MPTAQLPGPGQASANRGDGSATALLRPLGRALRFLTAELVAFLVHVLAGALLGLLVTVPLFWLLGTWDRYQLSQGPPGLVPLGIVLGVVAWLGQVWQRLTQGEGDSHGSARFAAAAETRDLLAGSGLLIGRDRQGRGLLRYAGAAHLLTLAPTRSGKGTGSILPNLLTARRSLIVVDPG